MAFAYLLGCFGLGMTTKELIACWPTSTMFVILSVSLFYNFAAVNGTLEKVSSLPALYMQEISGNASIRFIFRGSSPFYNGSGVFYGTGISGSYYHADLRGSEDG